MPEKNQELPPSLYLRQVLEHCPRAGKTYCILWDNKDAKNMVHLSHEEIKQTYLYTMQSWRDHLRLLAKEGLINIDEKKESFSIELVGWDIDAEGFSLC